MPTNVQVKASLIDFLLDLEEIGFAVKVFDFGNNNLQRFYAEQDESKIASIWTVIDQKIKDQEEFKIYMTIPLNCKLSPSQLREMISLVADNFNFKVLENFDYLLLQSK